MMYNFVLDSDALIKLANAGILSIVCSSLNCCITSAVEQETVHEGKNRLYPDAEIIEYLIKNGMLKVKNPKKIVSGEFFGGGELSVWSLAKENKNHVVVSDDQKFIKYLEREGIDFVVPADMLLILRKTNKISLKEALFYLGKIKVFIKEEVYKSVKKELEEG